MDLFSDILKPLPTPVPISAVVEQVVRSIVPSHHPENRRSNRPLSTNRLGIPQPRRNPWQRNGRTLLGEACTNPAVAIRQSGLDWTVKRVDLRVADTLDPIQNFSAIRLSDTQGILGVVGPDYEPFQNRQMFDVFSDLAKVGRGDGGLPFSIETAGSFQGGRVVWALARMPDLGICIDVWLRP